MNPSPFARTALAAALIMALGFALTSIGSPPRYTEPVAAPTVPGEYIVRWPTGTAAALADMDGVAVVDSPGADELAKLGAFVVTISADGSVDVILAAGAEYVEPNSMFTSQDGGGQLAMAPTAGDPLIGQQWFHDAVGSSRAWRVSQGAGVRVAVVDSGVGPHPDLSVVAGKDFTGGDGQWTDHYGHGTHVAGICCARAGNDVGGSGIAPLADVLSARVLMSNGLGSLDGIAAGIVWAADNGAKVINLSLGGPSGTRSLQEALSYAAGRGALSVCSAGNDGSERPMYPAAFSDCLSVGASAQGDALASFTNRHSSVDISAPGMAIFSTCRGGGFCLLDGTSMSAPIVSGAAALVASLGPIAPAALSWRLRSTAALRPALPGGRRVDVAAALAGRPTAPPAPATALPTRQSTLAPRPTAPATARPLPTAFPTLGTRTYPVVVPPGCRVVVMCVDPYPGP